MHIPFDNTYVQLPKAFFAPVQPVPVSTPRMIRLNRDLAAELGIDPVQLESAEGLAILSGNKVATGSEPLAMAYSGHQFGGFSPQLGDGRAILLGEVIDTTGVRRDIQLKGAGQTPFSRRGDGRSALGPVLREYIVSEAMAALGVPTTRALAAVSSGDQVLREGLVPGGVFTRVAQSHIRIGTFQWFAARQDHANLKALADYTIERHDPEARKTENPYRGLLAGVIQRQAHLIAHWMQLGFIHGVMNTDNMTVSGETIDFGPCAFLDDYHPAKTFSSIDHQGRYAYSNQASIGFWNLTRFAETLLPLLHENPDKALTEAKETLELFSVHYEAALRTRFTSKIGLKEGPANDWPLVQSLLDTMDEGEADFTLVFRHLPDALKNNNDEPVIQLFKRPEAMTAWLEKWRLRLSEEDFGEALALMKRSNPVFIPRNHRIEQAIQAGNRGDFTLFQRLNEVLQLPFAEQPEFAEFEAAPAPEEIVCATFCGT